MAKYDDLDTKQIFIIGIGSVVVTVVTIMAVLYVYYLLVAGHESKFQAESSYDRQNTILADQFESVSKYGADPLTGNVTIPVNEAMKLVAKEAQSAKETPSANDKQPENANNNDAT
ncbi:MAG: hypothetical protein KDB00_18920 [Planctomycetales bacterium]|nr:hypothetical protein [Planctomycetales bacterium]